MGRGNHASKADPPFHGEKKMFFAIVDAVEGDHLDWI